MSVHEYSLKFTQLSCYAPEMVADMRSRMSLFVVKLSRLSSKEGKATMLIGDMDITRIMIHVQQVEKDKLRDREEFKNKRAKTSGDESGQQKSNANRSSFQSKQKGPATSSDSAHAQGNKGEYNSQNFRAKLAYSQGSMAQGGSKPPACAKCGRNYSGICHDAFTSCFKCVAPQDRAASRRATSGAGGGSNRLYAITSLQDSSVPSPEGENQFGDRKEQLACRRVVPRYSVVSPKVRELEDAEGQSRKAMNLAKGWIAELIGEPDLLR
uniref:Retrotransposon gag protein n=1 Tax=Solanum tuberosum TaxID=4113 RepID=M1DY51_SOLTU